MNVTPGNESLEKGPRGTSHNERAYDLNDNLESDHVGKNHLLEN